MSLEEYFSTGPEWERPVFEAVMTHLRGLGPVHVEPLSVGIFLKHTRTFAQLRPKTRWVALSCSLGRRAAHPRLGPKVQLWSGRYYHVFNLRSADDVDDELRALLTESYAFNA